MSVVEAADDGAVLARTTARLLSLGGWIAAFTLLVTAAALFTLALSPALARGWLVVPIIGAVAFYHALRARLDARLFDDLASALASGIDEDRALHALDASLAQIGLRKTSVQRSLADRARGAVRLLRRAAILTVVQLALSALLWLADATR